VLIRNFPCDISPDPGNTQPMFIYLMFATKRLDYLLSCPREPGTNTCKCVSYKPPGANAQCLYSRTGSPLLDAHKHAFQVLRIIPVLLVNGEDGL